MGFTIGLYLSALRRVVKESTACYSNCRIRLVVSNDFTRRKVRKQIVNMEKQCVLLQHFTIQISVHSFNFCESLISSLNIKFAHKTIYITTLLKEIIFYVAFSVTYYRLAVHRRFDFWYSEKTMNLQRLQKEKFDFQPRIIKQCVTAVNCFASVK